MKKTSALWFWIGFACLPFASFADKGGNGSGGGDLFVVQEVLPAMADLVSILEKGAGGLYPENESTVLVRGIFRLRYFSNPFGANTPENLLRVASAQFPLGSKEGFRIRTEGCDFRSGCDLVVDRTEWNALGSELSKIAFLHRRILELSGFAAGPGELGHDQSAFEAFLARRFATEGAPAPKRSTPLVGVDDGSNMSPSSALALVVRDVLDHEELGREFPESVRDGAFVDLLASGANSIVHPDRAFVDGVTLAGGATLVGPISVVAHYHALLSGFSIRVAETGKAPVLEVQINAADWKAARSLGVRKAFLFHELSVAFGAERSGVYRSTMRAVRFYRDRGEF